MFKIHKMSQIVLAVILLGSTASAQVAFNRPANEVLDEQFERVQNSLEKLESLEFQPGKLNISQNRDAVEAVTESVKAMRIAGEDLLLHGSAYFHEVDSLQIALEAKLPDLEKVAKDLDERATQQQIPEIRDGYLQAADMVREISVGYSELAGKFDATRKEIQKDIEFVKQSTKLFQTLETEVLPLFPNFKGFEQLEEYNKKLREFRKHYDRVMKAFGSLSESIRASRKTKEVTASKKKETESDVASPGQTYFVSTSYTPPISRRESVTVEQTKSVPTMETTTASISEPETQSQVSAQGENPPKKESIAKSQPSPTTSRNKTWNSPSYGGSLLTPKEQAVSQYGHTRRNSYSRRAYASSDQGSLLGSYQPRVYGTWRGHQVYAELSEANRWEIYRSSDDRRLGYVTGNASQMQRWLN